MTGKAKTPWLVNLVTAALMTPVAALDAVRARKRQR